MSDYDKYNVVYHMRRESINCLNNYIYIYIYIYNYLAFVLFYHRDNVTHTHTL